MIFQRETDMPHREGFALAGAWLIEHEKIVSHYPAESGTARKLAESQRVGGQAFNMARRLRELAADLPLYAIGCIGDDEDGHAVLSACHQLEIDTYQLQAVAGVRTAHIEALRSHMNGSCTRFYYGGANDLLGLEHFDFCHCLARWFHLGDLHLLARMAEYEEEFGTIGGRVLQTARASGLHTSLLLYDDNAFDESARLKMSTQADYLFALEEEGLLFERYCKTLQEA